MTEPSIDNKPQYFKIFFCISLENIIDIKLIWHWLWLAQRNIMVSKERKPWSWFSNLFGDKFWKKITKFWILLEQMVKRNIAQSWANWKFWRRKNWRRQQKLNINWKILKNIGTDQKKTCHFGIYPNLKNSVAIIFPHWTKLGSLASVGSTGNWLGKARGCRSQGLLQSFWIYFCILC